MSTHRLSRLAAGMVLVFALCTTVAHAQTAPALQQPPSLGDAARRVREQTKSRQPAKVISNDDLADIKGTVSVVGAEPVAPAAADATQAAGSPIAPKGEVKDEAYWRGRFAAARKQLAGDSKELDILQREYNLKEQQFYSNPNVALREQNSRADLNKTRDDINSKKTDVDKDLQAITSLEDELRRAGGNPGWSRAQ